METTAKVTPSKALEFARDHGFDLQRQPFGKRGSLIEVYKDGQMIDYRKSWSGALHVMKKIVSAS